MVPKHVEEAERLNAAALSRRPVDPEDRVDTGLTRGPEDLGTTCWRDVSIALASERPGEGPGRSNCLD